MRDSLDLNMLESIAFIVALRSLLGHLAHHYKSLPGVSFAISSASLVHG